MKFGFQINLDVKDRPCLVVGGGEEAADKANRLLEAGAKVTITIGVRNTPESWRDYLYWNMELDSDIPEP